MANLTDLSNVFTHGAYPFVANNVVLAGITSIRYVSTGGLTIGGDEVSIHNVKFTIRKGLYSYSGGVPAEIMTTITFPYTGGPFDFNLGVMQSAWIYYLNDPYYMKDVITISMSAYVKKTDGQYWYTEVVISSPYAINYSKPWATFFNVSRDTVDETNAILAFNIHATSIREWSPSTLPEKNQIKYRTQYHNGIDWVDLDTNFITPGVIDINVETIKYPFLADKSYQIRLVIQDNLETTYITDVLSTAVVPFSMSQYGVGVGKIWEQGVFDLMGPFYRDNMLQPKIFKKKKTDPDPDGMEDGDILIIYNELEAFSSANFPQEFGTGIIWGQPGAWPTDFLYWTSMSSTSNTMIESFQASAFKGDNYPSCMFDNNPVYYNGYNIPLYASPATVIMKFKGKISFSSFTLTGWGQDHETLNSPKSFAFFGSNDGQTWTPLYDTVSFTNTWKTSASANMNNSGMSFEYLKMVWRANQNNNGTGTTMIAIQELKFVVSGYKYV